MLNRMHVASVVVAGALLGGCVGGGLEFRDDVDLSLDFTPFGFDVQDDHLHTPYVQGAQVRVRVEHVRDRDLAGATISSTDEGVFQIVSTTFDEGDMVAEGVAVGPGSAELEVYDPNGDLWDFATVEVGFPTRVELHAAGPMFVDLDGLEAVPQVLVGGTATFQVQYFDGDERLLGNGALTVTPGTGTLAEADRSFLFENREWVRVSPDSAGTHTVSLDVDGVAFDDMTFDAVDAGAVAGVDIFGRDERHVEAEDWLVLLAQSYDEDDVRIYGVDFTWEIDGVEAEGEGDLYRYQYDPNVQAPVVARFGAYQASVVANVGEGYVDSSNNIGCNALGVPAGFTALWLGIPAVLLRRRR